MEPTAQLKDVSLIRPRFMQYASHWLVPAISAVVATVGLEILTRPYISPLINLARQSRWINDKAYWLHAARLLQRYAVPTTIVLAVLSNLEGLRRFYSHVSWIQAQRKDTIAVCVSKALDEGRISVAKYLVEQLTDWGKLTIAECVSKALERGKVDIAKHLFEKLTDEGKLEVILARGEKHADKIVLWTLPSKPKDCAQLDRALMALVSNVPSVDAVRLFVKCGADVNVKDNAGETPLFIASKKGWLEVVKTLAQLEADPTATTKMGLTPLHIAAGEGRSNVIRTLVKKFKTDVDIPSDNNEQTPLEFAAAAGHSGAVETLVNLEANINATEKNGWTALHCAANWGHVGVIKKLRELRPNIKINVTNNAGNTPLHLAADRGHLDAVKLLVEELGANIQVLNAGESTPLQYASYGNHPNKAVATYLQGRVDDNKRAVKISTTSE